MKSKYIYLQYFIIVFYCLQIWRYFSLDFLNQVEPSTQVLKFDIANWWLASTGLGHYLIANPDMLLVLDILYVLLPLTCYIFYRWGVPTLLFLFVIPYFYFYALIVSLFPSVSPHGNVYIQLIPFLFLVRKQKDILLMKDALRYFICLVMFVAGFWKVYYGSVFEMNHMANVLSDHNLPYLLYGGWEQVLASFLIEHPPLAQVLFISACVLELSFIVGFFTYKWDRILMNLLFAFIVLDLIVMRIPYFPFLSFLIFFVPLKTAHEAKS